MLVHGRADPGIGTVRLYLLAALLLAVPYERWRKKVACAQSHVANLW